MSKSTLIYRETPTVKDEGNSKEATVGYCAGLIDGEAYIGLCINRVVNRQGRNTSNGIKSDTYHPLVRINMTSPDGTDACFAMFGGRYYYRHLRQDKRKPMYTWEVSGRLAMIKILPVLIPHLRVKKAIAEILLEYCVNFKRQGGRKKLDCSESERRKEFYLRIKKLVDFRAPATTERVEAERPSNSLNPVVIQGEESEVVPPPTLQ